MTTQFYTEPINPRLQLRTDYANPMRRFKFLLIAYFGWVMVSALGFGVINGLVNARSQWLLTNFDTIHKVEIIWLAGVGLPLCVAVMITTMTARKDT